MQRLFSRRYAWTLLFVLHYSAALQGQAPPASHADVERYPSNEVRGEVPSVRGFNASVSTSSQHDSYNGWSSVVTSDLSWRFDRRFSIDGSVPLFNYIVVDAASGENDEPESEYETKRFAPGDVALTGSFRTHWALFDNNVTATLGLPSGKTEYGLGAGKVTYGIEDQIERDFGRFAPSLAFGVGNSSNTIGPGPILPYVANATLLYFQTGATVFLPRNVSFSAEAFEELPLSASTIYSTTTRGRDEEANSAEDNGFYTLLDIPMSRHVVLSSFYSRSLINRYDIAGFSLTFRLHVSER